VERFSKVAINSFDVQQLEYAVELLFQLYRDIRYSLNQRFELDILLSKMSSLSVYISPENIINNIGMLRNELLTGSVSASITTEDNRSHITETEAAGSENPDAANQFFNKFRKSGDTLKVEDNIETVVEKTAVIEEIVQEKSINTEELKTRLLKHLKSANMSLHAALSKAKKWELNNKVLTLTFNSLFESSFVTRESNFIIDEIKKLFELEIRIDTISEIGEMSGKSENKTDPQIDLVKSVFRGQLIRGEK
jgi:DNA polymerase III subunit gamma/tau